MNKFNHLITKENQTPYDLLFVDDDYDDAVIEELENIASLQELVLFMADFEDYIKPTANVFINLEAKEVYSEGGYEGAGEYAERVYKITDLSADEHIYVRRTGFYSSYAGTEWDDELTEVVPKPIARIEYIPK